MRLIKFRIKNFKSIIDTGECELASDISILAGKNESGKTVILQALDKFNKDKDFDEEDRPLDNTEAEPEVSLTFTLSKEDFSELIEKIDMPKGINKKAILEIPFSISKSFDNIYSLDGARGSIVDLLIRNYEKQNKKLIDKLNKNWSEIKKLFKKHHIENYPLQDVEKIDDESISRIKNEFLSSAEQFVTQLPPESQEDSRIIKKDIEDYITEIESNSGREKNNQDQLLELIPSIVLFDTFDQREFLPFDPITLEEAEKNQAVKNYFFLTDTDINKLKELRDQKKDQRLSQYIKDRSFVLEENFKDYWKQDKIDLRLEWVIDNKLAFYFYETRKRRPVPFKLSQRSKGLQWFLSFYLTVAAECEEHESIILIDEPGLFVHAKAQEDILGVLRDTSRENQIIFTTHSPYLINPDRLDRIKLIVKDLKIKKDKKQYIQKGTKIYSLTKEINIDRDTLTPIITAIGLDVSRQLTIATDNNIIVEGLSDYHYLQAALKFCKEELKRDIRRAKLFHIIPCTGANNIPSIVSILFGWGLKFFIVLDNDRKGKEIYKILTERLSIKSEKIEFVSSQNNCCIEDLFTKNDFRKYILNKPRNYKTGKLNSQIISDSQKIILSQQFLRLVIDKKISLSGKTKESFIRLLKIVFNGIIK